MCITGTYLVIKNFCQQVLSEQESSLQYDYYNLGQDDEVYLQQFELFDIKLQQNKLGSNRDVAIHDKIFNCTICSFATKNEIKFKNHLSIHTGDRPYACNVCHYRASQKQHLERHMKIHTGERDFACHLCSYRGTQKANLDKHLTTHTGEKPFLCFVCDYKSGRKDSLKNHMIVKHSDLLD